MISTALKLKKNMKSEMNVSIIESQKYFRNVIQCNIGNPVIYLDIKYSIYKYPKIY